MTGGFNLIGHEYPSSVWLSASVFWLEKFTCELWALVGKFCGKIARLNTLSHHRCMVLTALLTYTIERHVTYFLVLFLLLSLAKKEPSGDR